MSTVDCKLKNPHMTSQASFKNKKQPPPRKCWPTVTRIVDYLPEKDASSKKAVRTASGTASRLCLSRQLFAVGSRRMAFSLERNLNFAVIFIFQVVVAPHAGRNQLEKQVAYARLPVRSFFLATAICDAIWIPASSFQFPGKNWKIQFESQIVKSSFLGRFPAWFRNLFFIFAHASPTRNNSVIHLGKIVEK
jgi:hypothetical protein